MTLLTSSDAKTPKGVSLGYLTGILYLIPDDTLCPMSALARCRKPCLVSAGRGQMKSVVAGRQRKTDLYYNDPVQFVELMTVDVVKLARKAARMQLTPVIRPNGTSDLPWENLKGKDGVTLPERFPALQFYDYTKMPGRKVPDNYHLTTSYSEADPSYAKKAASSKHNIAVVFGDGKPVTFLGRQVVNGDAHDLRFLDASGVVVGLKAKGKARYDDSGFVIWNNSIVRVK